MSSPSIGRSLRTGRLVVPNLCLFACAMQLWGSPVEASQEHRRPGLGGPMWSRRLTQPLNSLGVIAGPLQTPLFGQRYGETHADGGFSVETHRTTESGSRTEYYARAGVVFGLTPHLEAGALFLSFRMTPDFHYADFPVYITYGWQLGPVEIGARLSFLTPAESSSMNFNPSVPLVIHLRHTRIDTGVFVPILSTDGGGVGINLPFRLTYNLTPRFFFGGESGLYEAAFGKGDGATSSLGAFLGYSTILNQRVVDVSARIFWDEFLRYSPKESENAVGANTYQIFVGATFHSSVM